MDIDEANAIVLPHPRTELVRAAGADKWLAQIRPEWQATHLIQRVQRLLPVDPGSACQRLFNATVSDLRKKILVAGIDIAKEAAERHGLPPVVRGEELVENYPTARVLDLAYRMGLVSRPEWRRLTRCYEIRGDLEHEDDQYDAEAEDILYIFKSCIEIVLSRDPVDIIRLSDVKQIIEVPQIAVASSELLYEYEMAPETRQRSILEHLVNTALDSKKADIIRQNAMELLRDFSLITKDQVKVELGQWIQERVKQRLELVMAKVAFAAGVLPYLKQRRVADHFEWQLERLEKIGYGWRHFAEHEQPLDDLEDIGGLRYCPEQVRQKLVTWMVLCYIGEPGGYGLYGTNRRVFNSDVAAPRISKMFKAAGGSISEDLAATLKDTRVQAAMRNTHVARRFEKLQDVVAGEDQP